MVRFDELNWIAVVFAAVAAFGLRFLWYTPPFLNKKWIKLDENPTKDSLKFSISFFLILICAMGVCLVIRNMYMLEATFFGGLVGCVFAVSQLGVLSFAERKSFVFFAIDAAYIILSCALMALVYTLFRK